MAARPGFLRIIAGEFRSRRIAAPADASTTRPLPDRVRESLFNLMRGHIEDQHIADVFAGTGCFGLEAVSRGAAHASFYEMDRGALKMLRGNIGDLGVEDRTSVLAGDALGHTAASRLADPPHVVFFDPPYPLVQEPAMRRRVYDSFARFVSRLNEGGFAILRTPWPYHDRVPEGEPVPAPLEIEGADGPETHEYGSTAVHLYMRRAD